MEWNVRKTETAGVPLYEVYYKEKSQGLFVTREDAERVANFLNNKEKKND